MDPASHSPYDATELPQSPHTPEHLPNLRRQASTAALDSPTRTSSYKQGRAWFNSAKSSFKALLSTGKPSGADENASPTRRQKSIMGLYDSFRNRQSSEIEEDHGPARPRTTSPVKVLFEHDENVCHQTQIVKRRKSLGNILSRSRRRCSSVGKSLLFNKDEHIVHRGQENTTDSFCALVMLQKSVVDKGSEMGPQATSTQPGAPQVPILHEIPPLETPQQPPPKYKSKACCEANEERPKTPDEYLYDLILSHEIDESTELKDLDHLSVIEDLKNACDPVPSLDMEDSTDLKDLIRSSAIDDVIGELKYACGLIPTIDTAFSSDSSNSTLVEVPQSSRGADSFMLIRHLEDVNPGFRERSKWREDRYKSLFDDEDTFKLAIQSIVAKMAKNRHFCRTRDERFWELVHIGAHLMGEVRPHRTLKDIHSSERLRSSQESLDQYIEQSVELRTAPLEDFPKPLRRETRKLHPCPRKGRRISTEAITIRFPASSPYASDDMKAYESRESAIADLYKDGMREFLADYGTWDPDRRIIEVFERGVEPPTGPTLRPFYLPLQSWPGAHQESPKAESTDISTLDLDGRSNQSSDAAQSDDEFGMNFEPNPNLRRSFSESDSLKSGSSLVRTRLEDIAESVSDSWLDPSDNDLATVDPIPTWTDLWGFLREFRQQDRNKVSEPLKSAKPLDGRIVEDISVTGGAVGGAVEGLSHMEDCQRSIAAEDARLCGHIMPSMTPIQDDSSGDENAVNISCEQIFENALKIRKSFSDFEDCLRAIAAEDAQFGIQTIERDSRTQKPSANPLSELEDCMKAIAAEDALLNLAECYRILATVPSEEPNRSPPEQPKPKIFQPTYSEEECLIIEAAADLLRLSSYEPSRKCNVVQESRKPSYASGFKFSTHGHILDDEGDDRASDGDFDRSVTIDDSEMPDTTTNSLDHSMSINGPVLLHPMIKSPDHTTAIDDLKPPHLVTNSSEPSITNIDSAIPATTTPWSYDCSVSLEDLNVRPMGKGTGGRKVGALVNLFQAHSIILKSPPSIHCKGIFGRSAPAGLPNRILPPEYNGDSVGKQSPPDSPPLPDAELLNNSEQMGNLRSDYPLAPEIDQSLKNIQETNDSESKPKRKRVAVVAGFATTGFKAPDRSFSIDNPDPSTPIDERLRAYDDEILRPRPSNDLPQVFWNHSGKDQLSYAEVLCRPSSCLSSADTDVSEKFGERLRRFATPVFEGVKNE